MQNKSKRIQKEEEPSYLVTNWINGRVYNAELLVAKWDIAHNLNQLLNLWDITYTHTEDGTHFYYEVRKDLSIIALYLSHAIHFPGDESSIKSDFLEDRDFKQRIAINFTDANGDMVDIPMDNRTINTYLILEMIEKLDPDGNTGLGPCIENIEFAIKYGFIWADFGGGEEDYQKVLARGMKSLDDLRYAMKELARIKELEMSYLKLSSF